MKKKLRKLKGLFKPANDRCDVNTPQMAQINRVWVENANFHVS